MPGADQNGRIDATESRDDGLQVLRRAASALDEIATAPGRLRLVDLGTNLGLAKSTARRLLVALVDVGFAAVDDGGRYHLGDRLLGLTSADGSTLAARLRPVIERVALATGETVDLSVLRGRQMWFVDQIESAHRLRAVSAVGGRFPLHDTANGKAALALMEDDAIPDGLLGEIAEIRRTGIAYDRDEHTAGISAAGIAVRLPGGHVVAISVPAPTERFLAHEATIVDALRAAAADPVWTGGAS
ncbi:IclR family transcriptional regulator [Mycolicibacterium austroafricanum]|uniref:IclR family transcriptional regulator n=1 Tax=Mycolicibacterium austroafricanum TaxID=39687 RepID=UPI00056B7B6A|nr:IclR family transcriptional regulator [Mycolicibacterium austroafricanum]QZY46364.1 IclR family transcriptional regulator [Mycolicibacterium austroafricanum]